MSRRIMETPYRNAFQDQEFPPDTGPFFEIPLSTFKQLYFCNYIDPNKLWISTTKGWNFICADHIFTNEEEFQSFLKSYTMYNCTRESGSSTTFWVDVGDIKLSQYKKLKSDYIRMTKINHLKMLLFYEIAEI